MMNKLKNGVKKLINKILHPFCGTKWCCGNCDNVNVTVKSKKATKKNTKKKTKRTKKK
jgi:hypothetical protein